MNIKKIIRESFEDEFSWVEDVPLNPFLVEQGNTYFVNIDMNLTEEQSRLVWDWLIEAGLTTTHQVIQYGRVEKLTKQKGTHMAIKSNGDFRYNIKKHVPSVQIKVLKISDFLNKEEDLKEEQIDLFGGEDSKYERCSHFSNNPKHKELCFNLYTLGTFLYKDLGLKNIINQKIRLMGEVKDLNDKYQEPLELVYNTGLVILEKKMVYTILTN